jgi:hypothetical protein
MSPRRDSPDGPIVRAAQAALDAQDVDLVVPFVPAQSEDEVLRAFDLAEAVRDLSPAAHLLADRYFCETVVRLRRAADARSRPAAGPSSSGSSTSRLSGWSARRFLTTACPP